MAEGVALQPGIDPNDNRGRLYKLLQATDYRLLGNARANHRAAVRHDRVAGRKRQGGTIAVDRNADAALARVFDRDECDVVAKRSESFQRRRHGTRYFHLADAWHLTAGVHALSWQICRLGLIMALGIRAIAWIENSALIFALVAAGVLGIVGVFWWHWGERREPSKIA